MAGALALAGYLNASDRGRFCHEHYLHPKLLKEAAELAAQLLRTLRYLDSAAVVPEHEKWKLGGSFPVASIIIGTDLTHPEVLRLVV